jgi:hypothetical protein
VLVRLGHVGFAVAAVKRGYDRAWASWAQSGSLSPASASLTSSHCLRSRPTNEATSYIKRKGGTLSSAHIYVDDAISRAEFKKRPGLIAVLVAASDGAFDAVVTRDES